MENIKDRSIRKEYSAEFKAEAVRLIKSGERKQAEVSRNLGVSTSTISKWCSEDAANNGEKPNIVESAKIRQLESEVRRLKLEQEILKKAAAYFAKNLM